jgi:GT2 family glycosyltransferase
LKKDLPMNEPLIGAVAIGRNEGPRLVACLRAALRDADRVVYVDSGSADGSAARARALGAAVVTLDLSRPFTAARARDAGLRALLEAAPGVELVQFVDGDCELREGWVAAAADFLRATPRAAVACGRRRERFPEASLWNRLCDREWDTPVGEARHCGGDALMRVAALRAVGGWRCDLIAGEEPELCVRLRRAGWTVHRLDREMTWHDAAMTRFGQWWRRSVRAGHAFAEGAALHGGAPERHWVRETARAVLWGAAGPAAIVAAAVIWSPWALAGAALWPAQVARLALRDRGPERWTRAGLAVLGKVAEAQGAFGYALGRLRGRRRALIEYKGVGGGAAGV